MARALVLLKLTREGGIYEETKIFFAQTGYKVVDLYATLGEYDFVSIIEASDENATGISFAGACWRQPEAPFRFAPCQRCRLRSVWESWMRSDLQRNHRVPR